MLRFIPVSLFRAGIRLAFGLTVPFMTAIAGASDLEVFTKDVQPILDEYCYDCHGNGNKKGGVQLDGFENDSALHDHKLWMRALKNVRSGIMPPADEPGLPPEQAQKIAEWIKRGAFSLDPAKTDPGRVTVRRLNRVEYRNTIRELLGVDYDTQREFPADDTGYGFDNIGDVLTISPMLLEKYLDAALEIISSAVPAKSKALAENIVQGADFVAVVGQLPVVAAPVAPSPTAEGQAASPAPEFKRPAPVLAGKMLDLSFYTPSTATAKFHAAHAGVYKLNLDVRSVEHYVDEKFDLNRCHVTFKVDGETVLEQEFVRDEDERFFKFSYERNWQPGDHELRFEVKPIAPDQEQNRLLRVRVASVTVQGPLDDKYWAKPANYDRFFPREVPRSVKARRAYARELLEKLASRAFRRTVDSATTDP